MDRPSSTMPAPLTLYLAACQYPAGVLERSQQVCESRIDAPANMPGPADRALKRLTDERIGEHAERRQAARREQPDAMVDAAPLVLTGDLIYADATAGLFDPRKLDSPWDRAWDTRSHNPLVQLLARPRAPIDMLDDHEIADNWEPSNHKARNAALRELMYRGRAWFIRRSTRAGKMGHGPGGPGLWFEDQLNGHFLFIGDTRTERQARDPAGLMTQHIMGPAQMSTLKQGLQNAAPQAWKLVATSSMLLPRPLGLADDATSESALRCDSWCGYPASLHELLAHIADQGIQHCIFLSGDEHLPSLTNIDVQRIDLAGQPKVRLISVHAGALYAPYPFANARPASFLEADRFEFTVSGRRYQCTVRATFPPVRHEGYVKIHLSCDPPTCDVWFRDALDPARDAAYANVSGVALPG